MEGQEQPQSTPMPRPTKVTHYAPIFAVPPEQDDDGQWMLRFISNPMEHVVITIPAEVAVAIRDGLPSAVIDRSASKIVTP